ncbi:MAG: glutamine--tRNA ligase/YqeY domain fusion protein [Actinobacteria bacterium]|nr:glutamine--tRNA ligase/YqeY domain fusion protein [Actinomycetota bacterium]
MSEHPRAPDTPPAANFVRELVLADRAKGDFGGRVQTRFPPEPNGYLHIGHAKAICVDFGIAEEFGGICKLRFDDTNPETEETEYVDAIVDDVRWLGFEPGEPLYASDYFEQLYQWAEHLIATGFAYVDDQDAETISAQRGGYGRPGVESPFRSRDVEENLDLFRRMRAGEFADGAHVLRAKADMQHDNMQLRDPIMYRIRHEHHHRAGDAWVLYPTYDWAHGQSDAIEGVTHSLCSLEFDSHRALYDWYLEHLPLPGDQPRQIEFARLELTHTVTSKRKLRELIDDGLVDGWDDPRLPTLRALRRRGYPPSAIREFCEFIGVGKTNSRHQIELLEWFIRNQLNRTAPRRMTVLHPIKLVITNWPDGRTEMMTLQNNPEDPADGIRDVPFTGELWIEADDFMAEPSPKYYRLSPGSEVRLRGAFFVKCTGFETDGQGRVAEVHCTYDPETRGGNSSEGRKVKATIHWVSTAHAIDVRVALYDRLFTADVPGERTGEPLDDLNRNSKTVVDAKAEPAVAAAAPGQVLQFERLGYFAADGAERSLFHRTVGLKVEWANIQKRPK